MTKVFKLFILACAALIPTHGFAQDNYRWSDELSLLKRIDKLPQYRTGSYVESFSSYDRTHGNDDGFAGTYSFIRKEDNKLVIAEMKGPGVIDRIWTPTPNETMLYFYFDGAKEPGLSIKFSDLFSGKVYPFVKPVCGNEVGGYYCYVPITYKKSCKIVYDGPKLEFIQIGYRNLTTKKVETYNGQFTAQDRQILKEVCDFWATDNVQAALFANGKSAGIQTVEKEVTLTPGEEVNCFALNSPGRIVGMQIDGGTAFEGDYKDIILSARWDDEPVEAIYAPLQDFFGYAFGHGAMRSILMGKQGNDNYCFLPMPFDRSAKVNLVYKKRAANQPSIVAKVKIHYTLQGRSKDEAKFYSVWRRQRTPLGIYHTFLQTKGKGHYVGTILQAQGLRPGMTLFFEGDDSTHVDGKMRLHGTGSEDYFNGGWYALLDRWDRGVSLPIHGSLDYSLPMARTGGYRFHLSDKMSFEKEIFHGMEHGPERNNFPVDYTSVAMFYSDTPLTGKQEPQGEWLKVYKPTTHIYFPQLFEMTIGGDISLSSTHGFKMTTGGQGDARVMLSDVSEGNYRVLLDYVSSPEGADFQVWQRQKQVSDWKTSRSDARQEKKGVHVGDIYLTKQTNSITFRVKKNENGNQFELRLITLERID
ncbi:MAG: glycoside hydrolase family 172 protein [Prevotella sp.]|jgi:hypothetical protein